MTDETKKMDELEGTAQGAENNETGCADAPVDDSLAAVDVAEAMPVVEGVDAPAGKPAAKRKARKGVIAGVAAAVVVIVIGVGVAFANQPESSGTEPVVSSSTTASSTAASGKPSSTAASSSSTSASSVSSAASSSEAAASGEAAKVESGQTSSDGNTAQAPQGATQAGGSTSGNTSGSTGGGTSGGNTSSGNGGGAAAAQPAHVHDWVPITEPHDVIDRDEWDEVVYQEVPHYGCSICGDCGNVNGWDHMVAVHQPKGESTSGGYFYVTEPVDTIHHPAEKHVEYEVVGYRCSGCGATK